MRMMRMTHLQVEAPHGLESNTQPRAPEGKELAIKDPGTGPEVRTIQILGTLT